MKQNYFSPKMAAKTTEELRTVMANQRDYQKEAVLAATWELEKRGVNPFEEKQDDELTLEKAAPAESSPQVREGSGISTPLVEDKPAPRRESHVTTDPNAPRLYPKWSLWVIGALVLPFFASIMMAMNIYSARKEAKHMYLALVLGIIPFLIIVLLPFTAGTPSYIINIAATGVILHLSWDKLLGADFKHRLRSPLIPIFLSAAFVILMVWLLFSTNALSY